MPRETALAVKKMLHEAGQSGIEEDRRAIEAAVFVALRRCCYMILPSSLSRNVVVMTACKKDPVVTVRL